MDEDRNVSPNRHGAVLKARGVTLPHEVANQALNLALFELVLARGYSCCPGNSLVGSHVRDVLNTHVTLERNLSHFSP